MLGTQRLKGLDLAFVQEFGCYIDQFLALPMGPRFHFSRESMDTLLGMVEVHNLDDFAVAVADILAKLLHALPYPKSAITCKKPSLCLLGSDGMKMSGHKRKDGVAVLRSSVVALVAVLPLAPLFVEFVNHKDLGLAPVYVESVVA